MTFIVLIYPAVGGIIVIKTLLICFVLSPVSVIALNRLTCPWLYSCVFTSCALPLGVVSSSVFAACVARFTPVCPWFCVLYFSLDSWIYPQPASSVVVAPLFGLYVIKTAYRLSYGSFLANPDHLYIQHFSICYYSNILYVQDKIVMFFISLIVNKSNN